MKPSFFDRSPLARHLWAFRREFLWVGIFSFFANVLMLTPTMYMLQIYDRVFKSQSEMTLLAITLVMVLFYGVMATAEWLRSRLLVRGGVRMDETLNSLVFDASFERHLKESGKNPTEAFSDLTTIRQFLTGNGIFAFFDTPWIPINIAVIFMLSPFLGWLSILFAGIQIAVAWLTHRHTIGDIEGASEAQATSSIYIQGKLRNIEPIHSMGMLPNLRERWLDYYERALSASAGVNHKQHKMQAISKFVRYAMQSLTLGAGALMVLKGEMGTGGMIAANVLMSRALQPLDLAMVIWKPFIQARDAFRRTERLLSENPPRNGSTEVPQLQGEVRLEGLVARAPGRPDPILHGLDAVVPAGKVVAVLGPSGSGKSTLARCLVGAWPDVDGKVLFDGTPIDSLDREALGPHIGYLPQDIELFEGTIAENISRFSSIDPDKVIDASRRTGIHDMLLRFPKGYDTEIGEAGSMLSGGQRQRLGLARAIYGNPEVVVLDEPNANLDDVGERALVQAVADLRNRGCTVFLITHRPSILGVADMMMMVSEGRIAHFGTRDEVVGLLASAAKASGPQPMPSNN